MGTTRRTTTGATTGRRRARLVVLLGLLPALLAGPAVAHEDHGVDGDHGGPGGLTPEKHAALDLAGQSVTAVERRTRAARQRLAAAGRLPRFVYGADGADGADGAGGGRTAPATRWRTGSWGPVVDTEVVPVFQAVLPNGKVLIWDSVGDEPTESYPDQSYTRAMVWDPATDTHDDVWLEGYNIFCAGYAQLPNGDVLVVGGNKNRAQDGIRQTHVFHWRTSTWSRGPDMVGERWYPSVTTTATGESLIVAGGPGRAEVHDTDGLIRSLSGFRSYDERLYPFLVPRLDGRVGMVGPTPRLDVMSTDGEGALERAGRRDGIDRSYGSFATFAPGRTLVSGGGPVEKTPEDPVVAPERSAVVVTDSSTGGTRVQPTGSMRFRRKQHQLTVLADGSVLATGGQRTGAYGGLVDLENPVLAAERWDPVTGRWTTLASADRVRQYHSTASLLPSGKVLTGGGGICAPCARTGYLEKNLETFTPPYLYRRDGRLADRPTVRVASGAVRVGTRFRATSPPGDAVQDLALVRLGAPTHSVDQGQRYVPLQFTRSGKRLDVWAPEDAETAPPGWYMLFGLDDQGVPSVADMVRVDLPSGPIARPVDLALNRPATASSTEAADLAPGLAADGNTATRWASAVSDDEWWQVDLGSDQTIGAVRTIWETAYAARYEVQTSLDGRTWDTVRTLTAPAPQSRRTAFAPRQARYVRIQGLERGTPYGYSLLEVGVYRR